VNLLLQDCRASRRLQGLVGELWHRLERAGERAATGDAANDAARGAMQGMVRRQSLGTGRVSASAKALRRWILQSGWEVLRPSC
jgi:hypothetical protein